MVLPPLQRFVVVARSDGRGGFRPFGTYSAAQAGAKVNIGNRYFTVGKDGRVNIPRSIMDEWGIKGTDGRMRVTVEFSAKAGKDGWREVATAVSRPTEAFKDAQTGDIIDRGVWLEDALEPVDVGEYNWSP